MISFFMTCLYTDFMKVLIVFNHPAPYKVRLFNELAKHFDLEVIFERKKAKNRPDSFYNCNEYNFKYTIINKCIFGEENSFSSELKNILKRRHQEFDLIIMNGYSKIAELKAIKYLNKKHIPYTLLINGGVIKKENSLKRKYKAKYISSAANYLSPCEEADEYLLYYGADKNKISHYVYSTLYDSDIIAKPLTKEEKEAGRRAFNLPNGDLYIAASQFIKRKNNEQLIKLFKQIKGTLLLVGEGKEKANYEKIIIENNITNVIIRPFEKRENLFKIMSLCDGFITLSKEDIYGHTTNEALAMGLPVLSSDKVIGSTHLIKDGVNGFVVKLNDEKDIIDKINKLKECSSLEAIKTAKENTIEMMAETTIKCIKDLMK